MNNDVQHTTEHRDPSMSSESTSIQVARALAKASEAQNLLWNASVDLQVENAEYQAVLSAFEQAREVVLTLTTLLRAPSG